MLCICFKFTENTTNDVSLIKSFQVVNKEMTDIDVSINCRHGSSKQIPFFLISILYHSLNNLIFLIFNTMPVSSRAVHRR